MRKPTSFVPLLTFIVALVVSIVLGRIGSIYILENYTDDYTVHSMFDIMCNMLLAFIFYFFIKKYELLDLAGLNKNKKLISLAVLMFPLYLVVVNASFTDEITSSHWIRDIAVLIVLCISIGLSDELALRGFLQSYLIKNFAQTKKQVV